MSYEYVTQFFLLLLALLSGAFLGCLLRRWTRSSATEIGQSREVPERDTSIAEAPATAAVAAVTEDAVSPEPVQARGLEVAIGGKADNLKTISGVGPKLEKTLNDLGIFHFEQIAGWSAQDVSEVDDLLSFKGRIERDDWVAQAKKLMDE